MQWFATHLLEDEHDLRSYADPSKDWLDAMSTLARLQTWYTQQCNGAWEHSSGVLIESCDNPGWWVKVNLLGTPLRGRVFEEVAEGVNTQHFPLGPKWLSCRVEEDTWHGAGDETKLERILDTFLAWAETNGI